MGDYCENKYINKANYLYYKNFREAVNPTLPGIFLGKDLYKEIRTEEEEEEEKKRHCKKMISNIKNGLSEFLGIQMNYINKGRNLVLDEPVSSRPPSESPNVLNFLKILKEKNTGKFYNPIEYEELVEYFIESRRDIIELLECSYVYFTKDEGVNGFMKDNRNTHFNRDEKKGIGIGLPFKEIRSNPAQFNTIKMVDNITLHDIQHFVATSNFYNEFLCNISRDDDDWDAEHNDNDKGLFWETQGDNKDDWFDIIPGGDETFFGFLQEDINDLVEGSQYIDDSNSIGPSVCISPFLIFLHKLMHIIRSPKTVKNSRYGGLDELLTVSRVNKIRKLHGLPQRLPSSYGLKYSDDENDEIPLWIFTKYHPKLQAQVYYGCVTYEF